MSILLCALVRFFPVIVDFHYLYGFPETQFPMMNHKGMYQEESTVRSMTAIVIKQEMLPGLVEKFIGDHLHALTSIYDELRLNELYELTGKARQMA